MEHAEKKVYTLWHWSGSIWRNVWHCSGPERRRLELAGCFWWKFSISVRFEPAIFFLLVERTFLLIYVTALDRNYGWSLAVIAGSKLFGEMEICLLWLLGVARYRSLRRAHHPSRGILPSVVCLSVIMKPR
jgi:hypothetical protein